MFGAGRLGRVLLLVLAANLGAAGFEGDGPALLTQGLRQEAAGDDLGAIASLKAALAADPTLVQADVELSRCYERLGWRNEALDWLQRYLDSGVGDAAAQAHYAALAHEGANIGAFDPGPAAQPALLEASGPWSLSAELGYGWGFFNGSIGHRYNRNANGNPFEYTYDIGQGVYSGLEASYALTPNLALGLAFNPLFTQVTDSEAYAYPTLSTSDTDSTTATQQVYPVLLKAHVRGRLGKNLKLGTFFGAGAAFGSPYVETSTDAESNPPPNGAYTTAVRYQRDVKPGLAATGGFNLELLLAPHWTAFLQVSLLLAQVWDSGASYSLQSYNAAGQLVEHDTDTDTYVPNPVKTQSVDSTVTTTTSGGDTITTYSYNNGPTQYTEVLTKVTSSGAQISDNFTETNSLSTSDANTTYKVLAASAGLRWVF